jgi:hypothetical protein
MGQIIRKVILQAMACLLGMTLACATAWAADIDGTWRLVKRVLPNGAVQVPPTVIGMGTASNGMRHLNVFWQTPDGKPASFGLVSRYQLTADRYVETMLASVYDDGSGKPVVYGLSGETKSSPVERQGGRIAYKLPFDPPSVVYDGDRLTATLEGQFVDHWERLR